MKLDDTRRFVLKMRDNSEFRDKVLKTESPEALEDLLRQEGIQLDKQEIADAMADYMMQMDR
jgi:hypothetical protein